MYIRMIDGREKGSVVDMRDDLARELLDAGKAVRIDVSDQEAFKKIELPTAEITRAHAEVPAPAAQSAPTEIRKKRRF
jgi:hypothetical protein